jgi:hypothetical protein
LSISGLGTKPVSPRGYLRMLWIRRRNADLQAEQQAILDSLWSESAAETRRRRRQEMETQEAVEEAEMLAYMDEVEQEEDEPEAYYPPIQPAPGTVVVDISHDED